VSNYNFSHLCFFAEQALEQGLQTLVIEPLREYNALKKLYDVVWVAKVGVLPLVTANPEPLR
jgi:HEPN domain-containing protein